MYLRGSIDIDPSHATEIRRKPTKGFRRFAEIITNGLLSEKEEHETFTAVAILQEINMAMRSLNITDVVRFTKDEQIIYDDHAGDDDDDMGVVFERLSDQPEDPDSVFKTLSLLLEHHLPEITLIIEVRIQRTHAVGSYPIQIVVNGLAAKFEADDESTLADWLEETFADSNAYAELEASLRSQFDKLMDSLASAVRKKMSVTDVRHSTQVNILRPRNEESRNASSGQLSSFDSYSNSSSSDPVFQRYSSSSDPFTYCWLWSHMMHSHGTHVQDATIVDEQGETLMNVGAEGIDASESSLLDTSTPFSETGFSGFDDESLKMSGAFDGGVDTGASATSWLDSFGFGDAGGSDAGSSCGSSCGGGD